MAGTKLSCLRIAVMGVYNGPISALATRALSAQVTSVVGAFTVSYKCR